MDSDGNPTVYIRPRLQHNTLDGIPSDTAIYIMSRSSISHNSSLDGRDEPDQDPWTTNVDVLGQTLSQASYSLVSHKRLWMMALYETEELGLTSTACIIQNFTRTEIIPSSRRAVERGAGPEGYGVGPRSMCC